MKFRTLVLCLATALNTGIACAGPADYVFTPAVEYGERELDVKFGSARQPDGSDKQVGSFGFGYGVSETWFTEIYLKREIVSTAENLTVVEWENKFQFTDTGQYPVDIGFITELEAPLSSNAPWELKLGPLFQTEFGKLQLNGNLLLERAFGKADESGESFGTNLGYQWQAKYRWQPILEFGVQGFGEMGKWNDWNKRIDQNHRIGPAIFGKFALRNRQAIKYNTAWLLGASNAAPNHTFRMQVEYEF
ncbi:hypothetical protein [Ferrigenium sp. UT5]|uniref:hypothetical protein n=1 Tax=Ferrigenium sp. UT5 TaxID=3242105 RepID=UPI003551CAA8